MGSNRFTNNNVFVGWGLYKLVINKVVDRDLFISILATFGIAIVFQQLMNFIFGADVVVAQSGYGTTMLFDNVVTLPHSTIFSAAISVLYAIVLVIYMRRSKLGRAIRATAQNARALCGAGANCYYVLVVDTVRSFKL